MDDARRDARERIQLNERLRVVERGIELSFGFDEMMRYHGGGSPGGVAHAFKALERALPLLSPGAGGAPERRAIRVRTAFGGPGARDGIELVTRAVTDGRYVVDEALTRPELGFASERFVFALAHRSAEVVLAVRPGIVTDEFITLARRERRSGAEEAQLDAMKRELADRVMGLPAQEVYDVVERGR